MILIVLSSFSEPGRPLATSNYYWSRTLIHHQPHPMNNNQKIFSFPSSMDKLPLSIQFCLCLCTTYFLQRLVSHPTKLSMIFIFWNILKVIFQLKMSHITVTLEYDKKLLITQEFQDAYITFNVCMIRPAFPHSLSPFPRSLAAWLQQLVQPWS